MLAEGSVNTRNGLGRLLGLAFALGITGTAVAQDWAASSESGTLGEVIVTAQRREQDIQSVGISVEAFSGETLRNLGITSTSQLGNQTPGLMVTDYNNPVITTFAIRGVSQIDFSDHQESPVAVFVDGAYVPYQAGIGMSMFDLDRAEILRGPQGTLFGRNATGGVVQLVTAKPTSDFEGYVDATGGQYGLAQIEGAVSGPLSDTLDARVSFLTINHDGVVDNSDGPDKGNADSKNIRLQLRYRPDSTLDFLLSFRGNSEHETTVPYVAIPVYINPTTGLSVAGNSAAHAAFCQSYFGTSGVANSVGCLYTQPYTNNPYRVSENDNCCFERHDTGVTATAIWDLSALKLTSISNYEHINKSYYPEDDDGTPISSYNFGQFFHAWNASEEVRLEGGTGRDRWVTGLYDLIIDGDYAAVTSVYEDGPPVGLATGIRNTYSLRDETWAIFGQNEFDMTPQLTLTSGLRWTQDRKEFEFNPTCAGPGCEVFGYDSASIVQGSGYNSSVPGAQTTRAKGNWSGKLQLDWRPMDNFLAYAGVTRGTKAGGYNAGATADWTVAQEIFKDEVLTNYEVGFKSTSTDNKLRFNGSAFIYDYSNLQVFSQMGTSVFTFNVDAKVHGAELELAATPVRGLELGIGSSWLVSLTDPIQNVNALTGNILYVREQLPFSPKFSANLFARDTWALGAGSLSLQADTKWVDTHKVELLDDPALISPSYAVANFRLTYAMSHERLRFTAFVNNAFNKVYIINGTPAASTVGSVLAIYGNPRWAGGMVQYRW